MNDVHVQEFIEHYGVKGMHWGVRNDRRVRPSSSEHKKVSELKKRKTHQLTNKQLKAVNERMNLEQNYHRLNPSSIKKGLAFAGAILGVAGMAMRFYDMKQSPGGKAFIKTGKAAMEHHRKLNKARKINKGYQQLKLFK